MFGTQTRFIAVAAVVVFSAATVLGAQTLFKGHFVETRDNLPNAKLEGDFFYLYDDQNLHNSRFVQKYYIGSDTVSNLYHYDDGVMYSMCTASHECSGILFSEMPDPWYDRRDGNNRYYQNNNGWLVRTSYVPNSGKINPKKHSPQVKRIKLGGNGVPTEIEFQDAGSSIRHVTVTRNGEKITDYNQIQSNANAFDVWSNCPNTAACPVFADLVFVLDNSNSVDNNEWSQQSEFVKSVLDSFVFATNAMEAAIVYFNSPEVDQSVELCGYDRQGNRVCGRNKNDVWTYGCGRDWVGCNRCTRNMTYVSGETMPSAHTANYIAYDENREENSQIPPKTVSPSREKLKTSITSSVSQRPPTGHTCQGYGLQLAMDIFDHSPRKPKKESDPPLGRIVIAVTDGDDNCPNTTQYWAQALKEMGVYLIEIGVGMKNDCNNYDERFLKGLASKLSDETTPAYFPVTSYNQIKSLADDMFKPICSQFTSQCGSKCDGFCGCGKCLCPDCDESHSSCFDYTCSVADDGSSFGCIRENITCEGTGVGEVDNVCTFYECDGTIYDNGRCSIVQNNCEDLKLQNPGTCRVVKCDKASNGCHVVLNNNYCQTRFGSLCEEYECTPVGQNVPDEFRETGCRPKEGGNKTLDCVNLYHRNGMDECFDASCDRATGDCVPIDKCPDQMPDLNKKCFTYSCEKNNGVYGCELKQIPHGTKTKCYDYECTSTGWKKKILKTADSCKEEFREDPEFDVTCRAFTCDDNEGCQVLPDPICDVDCTKDKINECLGTAISMGHSVDNCVAGQCKATKQGDDVELSCEYSEHKNCFQVLANKLEELNSQEGVCYTAECDEVGLCQAVDREIPSDFVLNKCMVAKCVKQNNGGWEWENVESDEKLSCVDNPCFTRTCNPERGCVNVKDICEIQTNKCNKFTCKLDSDGFPSQCLNESLLRDTKCSYEVCVDVTVDGVETKDVAYRFKDLDVVCPVPNGSLCYEKECKRDANTGESWCVFPEKKAPKECDDPCTVCECIDSTGKFDVRPKCVSGDNCTIDSCDRAGNCGAERIDCYELVDMSAFPCFATECASEVSEKGFKCLKKLLPNAYIDVCGECIHESVDIVESGEGETVEKESSEDNLAAVTECAGAPPKPILTEGLAAASIALIILAAVIVGAAIAASSVIGTKTLINRAKGANNQSAHTNPLFEETETEMTNPAFVGE